MDIEKLKKIAVMAQRGNPNERQTAKKILKKHGYTADELLSKKRVMDIPEQEPIDVTELTDVYFDDLTEKIHNFSESFVGAISSIRNIMDLFKK